MVGRGRPRHFSVDEVVDAAAELIERNGLESLSMHALAKRLGTGSATLYNYVGSRDELIDLVLGRVLSHQAPVPQATTVEEWVESVIGYLLDLFRDGIDRPVVLQLWHQRPHVHLGLALRAEEELRSLEAIGFSPTRAAEVYRMLASQLLGHLGTAAAIAQRPEGWVITDDSTLGKAQQHLDELGEEQIYASALRALVTSLAAELAETRERSRP